MNDPLRVIHPPIGKVLSHSPTVFPYPPLLRVFRLDQFFRGGEGLEELIGSLAGFGLVLRRDLADALVLGVHVFYPRKF